MDSIDIVLTNYGFWDIESNNTNDLVYTYSGTKQKELYSKYTKYDNTKLNTYYKSIDNTDIVSDYDNIWEKKDDVYYDGTVSYLSTINGHKFVGATDDFAVYASSGNEPLFILVRMKFE